MNRFYPDPYERRYPTRDRGDESDDSGKTVNVLVPLSSVSSAHARVPPPSGNPPSITTPLMAPLENDHNGGDSEYGGSTDSLPSLISPSHSVVDEDEEDKLAMEVRSRIIYLIESAEDEEMFKLVMDIEKKTVETVNKLKVIDYKELKDSIVTYVEIDERRSKSLLNHLKDFQETAGIVYTGFTSHKAPYGYITFFSFYINH